MKVKSPQKNTIPDDDQEDETEQSLSDSLQVQRQISRIHENMGTHQIGHWYGCHVSVEPSADSFWQPSSTVAVLVKHRNVQLVQS